MSAALGHVRHGIGSVRPYVHGHLDLWDLVRDAFGALELERHEFGPTSFHIEAQIGDSVIVLETGDSLTPEAVPDRFTCTCPMSMRPTGAPWNAVPHRSPLRRTNPIGSARPAFAIPLATPGGWQRIVADVWRQ